MLLLVVLDIYLINSNHPQPYLPGERRDEFSRVLIGHGQAVSGFSVASATVEPPPCSIVARATRMAEPVSVPCA